MEKDKKAAISWLKVKVSLKNLALSLLLALITEPQKTLLKIKVLI